MASLVSDNDRDRTVRTYVSSPALPTHAADRSLIAATGRLSDLYQLASLGVLHSCVIYFLAVLLNSINYNSCVHTP